MDFVDWGKIRKKIQKKYIKKLREYTNYFSKNKGIGQGKINKYPKKKIEKKIKNKEN